MKPWTWRHAIINSPLPPTTRHVLLTLSCHVNDVGEDCFPSTKTLARETGLSERSVCTHLELAATEGWFAVRKHGYGGQKWARHQYYPRVPDDFVLPDRDEKGAEERSVPRAKKLSTKALKEVQHLNDKGTEGDSVPLGEALNVIPEGTEPNDKKALKEVQSSTAVNPSKKSSSNAREEPPVDNSALESLLLPSNKEPDKPPAGEMHPGGEPPLTLDESVLLGVLRELEESHGKGGGIPLAKVRPHLADWTARAVRPDELRDAYRRAVAARERDNDGRPVNAGFLARFVDEVLAPAATAAAGGAEDGAPWYESTDPAVIEARGAELGVRARKHEEAIGAYRVLVVAASREKAAIAFVLADARKFNDERLYQFARTQFGDALMPVDDYAS
ncbi:helix-turn-helix domain-containing protein [Paraburkholderia sp. UCT2]|uniref:helix-turn-helix domain-containing protein n=1 Tax=Paraburkholderia sp. UCT2 TaxID=2615208 RepID=UPI00165656C0|nr:helix-turn-helix domain-containing protein [Paraburkholderia sp. UCT2]MBC8730005.1 helix-turn-helix domain-containing protein [Paraburkholderia sp. UCT2]